MLVYFLHKYIQDHSSSTSRNQYALQSLEHKKVVACIVKQCAKTQDEQTGVNSKCSFA